MDITCFIISLIQTGSNSTTFHIFHSISSCILRCIVSKKLPFNWLKKKKKDCEFSFCVLMPYKQLSLLLIYYCMVKLDLSTYVWLLSAQGREWKHICFANPSKEMGTLVLHSDFCFQPWQSPHTKDPLLPSELTTQSTLGNSWEVKGKRSMRKHLWELLFSDWLT